MELYGLGDDCVSLSSVWVQDCGLGRGTFVAVTNLQTDMVAAIAPACPQQQPVADGDKIACLDCFVNWKLAESSPQVQSGASASLRAVF